MKILRVLALQVPGAIPGNRGSHIHTIRAALSTSLLIFLLSTTPAIAQRLHKAAEAGNLEQVKQLVARGENVNTKDSEHNTPLHKSIWSGHFEIAKYLAEKGSDVNALGKTGATPLMYACRAGAMRVEMPVLSSTAKTVRPPSTISESSSFPFDGQLDMVKYLVGKGAKVNLGNEDGDTPLHNAVNNGYNEITGYLLKAGADANAKTTPDEATPLRIAAGAGYVETGKLLLKYGARVDMASPNGTTPLMLAAYRGHLAMVKLLLENGASVNARMKDGNSALSVSTDSRIIEVLKKAGSKK